MESNFDAKWMIERRQALGCTQVSLAVRAGISLPTLQNIEAGKANPSWDILVKVMVALGYTIQFQPQKINWSDLCWMGVPLLQSNLKSSKTHPTNDFEFTKALHELVLDRESITERETEALFAFVLALRDHYPSIFKRYKHLITEEWILKKMKSLKLGRLIKLRRIALANLQLEVFK